MELESKLESVFGHREFRPGQREVIGILLEGRPALAVFPTGAGKSLCYQLPALQLEGLTLVISPLIALMKDQVEALAARGVAAARLDSSLEAGEVRKIYDQMGGNALKLLYVAPERLANEGFLAKLRKTRIDMIAIDEAHCISEWGHNFRPDYLKLGNLTRALGVKRVLALTATATPRVAEDICDHFGIQREDHVHTGFRRENLVYRVTPCAAGARRETLLARLRARPPGPAIVYVTLQQTSEEVAGFLAKEGFRAKAYHAGLPDDYRHEVQDAFMAGEIEIVVATIAFGMGIDKADIRYVYHYNLPKSLENYVQESGRAGRDGLESVCEILACGDDRIVLENFVYGDTPSAQALKSLVEHLLLQGDEFDISRYELSGSKDIRPLVVATALTYLELGGVIEAKGPFYGSYRFQFVEPMERVLAGHTEERKSFLEELFKTARKGRAWWTVEVASAAQEIGEPGDRVQRALNYLADLGEIILQPSGLRHAYRLRPEHPRNLAQIVEELSSLFARRESGEIARLERVLAYCETKDCLPRHLLAYFGEEMEEDCGTCGNCLGEGAQGERDLPCSLSDAPTLEQVEVMRSVVDENHTALRQPRQLARFLCGITSPAASREKLSRHDAFGALAKVPFQSVLAQAESMVL